jgi:hypothetical protein
MFWLFFFFALLTCIAFLCIGIAVIAFLVEFVLATSRTIARVRQSKPFMTWVMDRADATPAELKRLAAVQGGRVRVVYFDQVSREWCETVITPDMPEDEIAFTGR